MGADRHMGMGAYPEVSLAAAREEAAKARALLATGINPLDERNRAKAANRLAAAREKTFDECREEFHPLAIKASGKSVEHAAQSRSSLTTYVMLVFGRLAVQAVNRAAVILPSAGSDLENKG